MQRRRFYQKRAKDVFERKRRRNSQPLFPGRSDGWEAVESYHDLRVRQLSRSEAPYEDLREFYGDAVDSLVEISWNIHRADFLMAQRGLAALLDDWTVQRECRYMGEHPAVLLRKAIQVGPEAHDFALAEGRQFWVSPDGDRFVLDLEDDYSPMSEDGQLTLTVPMDRHDWVRQLIEDTRKWMDEHHIMRGRAITAAGAFIKFDDKTEWDDVLLPEELKHAIEQNCIGLLQHKELYKENGIPLRRGLLLHGKPGTGKTMIGRALAQMCDVTFILATPGMIEDASDVRRIFSWGRRFAPSILYFEDFDMVARDRHMNFGNDVLGEFLSGLDGLDSRDGIIAVATTNDLTAIEPALKERPNRFDLVLEVPSMAAEQRARYLERWLERRPDCQVDIRRIVAQTDGFTGAQMQELNRLAVFEAVEEYLLANGAEPQVLPLIDAHYNAALIKMGKGRKKAVGFQAAG